MKVAITGSTGLVGSRVFDLLKDEFDWVKVDYEDGFDLVKEKRLDELDDHIFDGVIHIAGYADVAKAEAEAGNKDGLCYQLNVEGTRNLLKHIRLKPEGKVILISTGYVFDGQKPANILYKEDDKAEPANWYGQTKLWSEDIVKLSKLPFVILRINFPYGRRFEQKKDWVWSIVEGLREDGLPPQFTDRWFSSLWLDDMARAIKAVLKSTVVGETYHLVSPESLTHYDAGLMVAERIGVDLSCIKKGKLSEYCKSNPVAVKIFPRNCGLSSSKFSKHFNFAFTSWADGLQSVLQDAKRAQ